MTTERRGADGDADVGESAGAGGGASLYLRRLLLRLRVPGRARNRPCRGREIRA
eukprot:CAMPEP_0197454698 /NCGR_PEP_ID=MMETSP1175-20131217/38652_1 /TAXON_ID=1003142 /ORGANISM="Triceratium dubium, Strain CCMP147" /LENGTH=53 /DNA_ID=CAMNT_0042988349 /DNA_START=15 /DNA_END=172 /DNA_ORIENTATION=+